jgi:hypothetical protein
LRNRFAVVAAILEEMLGIGLLEVAAADFLAGYLGGDGQHRDAAAMAVVEAVDQVQVARTAASGAHRDFPGELAFRPRREGRRLLVAHVHPLDLFVLANRIRYAVQRVAGQTIDTFHAGLDQRIDKDLRDFHRHDYL